jgi:phosphoribosylaminoimidazole-succinocarboxamide synthase
LEKQELLFEGTSKRLYSTSRPSLAILEFTDEFPGSSASSKKGKFPGKGEVNCGISSFLFQYLENYHVPTHFSDKVSPTEMLVRKLDMFKIIVHVHNIATANLAARFKLDDGRALDYPIIEYYLKAPKLGNPMINETHALALGHAEKEDLRTISRIASKTNAILKSLFERRGLVLLEFQLEIGDAGDHICIADEISPDTCRIWDRKTNRRLDQDRIHQDLGGVEKAYRELHDRLTSAA